MGSAALQPSSQVEGFVIYLDVAENGIITPREVALGALRLEVPGDGEPMVLDFEGLSVKNVTAQSLNALLGSLGMGVQIPSLAIPAEQVAVLMEHGIQSVAIHKKSHGDSQEIGIFANDTKALQVSASDEALELTLSQLGLLDAAESLLGSVLMMDEATIAVSFPGAAGDPSFADTIEAEMGQALNMIELGATVSGNEVVSVAGITIAEVNEILTDMGLVAPDRLVLAPLDMLGAGEVVATVGRNGVKVEDDQGKSVEIAWDTESRAALYDLLPVAADLAESANLALPLDMQMIGMVTSVVEEWLPNTELQVALYDAASGEAADTLPEVTIGQIVKVELDESGLLSVGGVTVGKTALSYQALAPYQWAALRIDGKAKEIRSVVAGQQMPILFLGDNALSQLGGVVAEAIGMPELSKAPWEKVDALLGNGYIEGVELALAGHAPAEVDLDYSARAVRLSRYAIPSVLVSRQDGHIALGDASGAVDVIHYLGPSGKSIADMVKMYTGLVPQGLNQVSLTVDPNQAAINLMAEPIMGIRWDSKLRQNLLAIVNQATGLQAMVDMSAKDLATVGLSTETVSQIEATALEYLVGGNVLRWGVQLTLVDSMEEIPPTAAESVLSRFGLILLPEKK
jgi:hypothetical protein